MMAHCRGLNGILFCILTPSVVSVFLENGVKYKCIPRGHVQKIACCSGTITIVSAFYGISDSNKCPTLSTGQATSNCTVTGSEDVIKNLCDNETECEIAANDDVLGHSCPEAKYAYMEYMCSRPSDEGFIPETCMSGCPNGWTKGANVPFCYKSLSTGSENYTTASDLCEDNEGVVVMPKTRKEDVFLQDFIRKSMGNIQRWKSYVWIGLLFEQGDWRWNDGSTLPNSYKNYSRGQPDNFTNNESCTSYFYDLLWNDIDCGDNLGVICQSKMQVTCENDLNVINATGTLVEIQDCTLRYNCESPFYKLDAGDLTRICTANGTWSGSEPTCKRCNCSCNKLKEQNPIEDFDRMINELKVDKKTTSKVLRSKTSAKDDRPTAKGIGSFGVLILIGVAAIILIPDVPRLYIDTKNGLCNLISRFTNK